MLCCIFDVCSNAGCVPYNTAFYFNSYISMTTLAVLILLFLGLYFFWRRKQAYQQFDRHVGMAVSYLFQDRPGQYSGDYRSRGGVLIFRTLQNSDHLRNIVIRQVKLHHPAVSVNLEQILIIPFDRKGMSKPEVSIRFKINKGSATVTELKGERVSISGVLNFEQGKVISFRATLPISDIYQEMKTQMN